MYIRSCTTIHVSIVYQYRRKQSSIKMYYRHQHGKRQDFHFFEHFNLITDSFFSNRKVFLEQLGVYNASDLAIHEVFSIWCMQILMLMILILDQAYQQFDFSFNADGIIPIL